MTYEQLVHEVFLNKIDLYERNMPVNIKGLYADNIIWLNKTLPSVVEKKCVLAEELGHHHTTEGDILNQSSIANRKQELYARRWAYRKLVPLNMFLEAHRNNITNRYELADFIGVTEEFLDEAVEWYISKYGPSVPVEGYTISFEPFGVLEMFDFIEPTKITVFERS